MATVLARAACPEVMGGFHHPVSLAAIIRTVSWKEHRASSGKFQKRSIDLNNFSRAFAALPSTANPGARIKNVIAVASCKGGVGKSSICVNLAYMLSKQFNKKVGVLDVDVYGPSLPYQVPSTSFKVTAINHNGTQKINPIVIDGVKLMSTGFVRPDDYAAFRGPIVTGIVKQLMTQTWWTSTPNRVDEEDLDYLLLDMPPGTGDIHLTVAQEKTMKISGAVMVTTPQKLSLVDVEKGIRMFDKVGIPTIQIVENMSLFNCPNCGKESSIFGSEADGRSFGSLEGESIVENRNASAGRSLADQFGIPSFHQLPIDPQLGIPKAVFAVRASPDRPAFQALKKTAADLIEIVEGNAETGRLPLAMEAVPELHFDSTANPAEVSLQFLDATGSSHDSTNIVKKQMPARQLRLACRSALMWDEFTGEKLFKDEDISQDVIPKKIDTAGRYAMKVEWSDGHQSLFAYNYLKTLFGA